MKILIIIFGIILLKYILSDIYIAILALKSVEKQIVKKHDPDFFKSFYNGKSEFIGKILFILAIIFYPSLYIGLEIAIEMEEDSELTTNFDDLDIQRISYDEL